MEWDRGPEGVVAGRCLFGHCQLKEQVLSGRSGEEKEEEDGRAERIKLVCTTVIASAISSCLSNSVGNLTVCVSDMRRCAGWLHQILAHLFHADFSLPYSLPDYCLHCFLFPFLPSSYSYIVPYFVDMIEEE